MNRSEGCRWGILGTAVIAQKNWKAIWLAANATLTAVASRQQETAQQFIDRCQGEVPFASPPVACGSYDELLAREDVDAVYIPLPTGLRKEWVIRAAEAGKHVLAEKPTAVDARQLTEILQVCRRQNVQYMDGVMFMHSRRLDALARVLQDGASLGELRRVTSHHAFRAPDGFWTSNIRAHSQMEPHGCLGDLGWYSIRFILWAFQWQMPQRVSGRILADYRHPDAPQAVPTEFSAELFYADGSTASFYCSFLAQNQQWTVISGTQGFLHVPDFVLPFYGNELEFSVTQAVYDIRGCEFNMERHATRHAVREYGSGQPGSQETRMFETFSERVLTGQPDPQWPRIALQTQQVMDACYQSGLADGALVQLPETS